MKLQDGYTNLEWSKKLKVLGVRQESNFYWVPDFATDYRYDLERPSVARSWKGVKVNPKQEGEYLPAEDFIFAAFSTAELGEILPPMIDTLRLPSDYPMIEGKVAAGTWACLRNSKIEELADTEANARASMLVYLLENKIITVEEVNARLAA